MLVFIDQDKSLFEFDLRSFQAQALRVRHAADSHQKHFSFELYVFALRSLAGDDDTLAGLFQLLEFGIDLEFDAPFAKRLRQFGGDFFVFERNQARQQLNYRRLCAES